jgi:hypothetical protein
LVFYRSDIVTLHVAVSKAGAAARKLPLYRHYAELAGNSKLVLPVPAFNVINGGSHAGNRLAFQEFMILPLGANSFSEAVMMGCEVVLYSFALFIFSLIKRFSFFEVDLWIAEVCNQEKVRTGCMQRR